MIEVITILLATMALASKHIRFLFRISLSGVTAYWIFKFFYPRIDIGDYTKYSKEQISNWLSSGDAFKAMLFTSVSYFFFYVVIRFLIELALTQPMTKWVKRNQKAFLENRQAQAFVVKGTRRIIRLLIRWGGLRKDGWVNLKSSDDFIIFESNIWLCTTLHGIFCWFILGINNSLPIYILAVIIVLMIVIMVISIPCVVFVFSNMHGYVKHDADLIEKGILKKY